MIVKKFLKSFCTLSVVGMLVSNITFATIGTVTGSNVRIREKANSKSIEVSVATKGEKVEIIGEEGDWYHIKFEKITGYISKDYVDTKNSSENTTKPISSNNTTSSNNENKVVNNSTNNKISNEIHNENMAIENTDNKISNEIVENTNNISSNNTNEINNKVENTSNEIVNDKIEENSSENNNLVENNQVNTNNSYQKDQKVTILKDTELRYLPSFSSRVQVQISSGSEYKVIASLNNWVKISDDNNIGWILKVNVENKEDDKVSTDISTSPTEDTEASKDNTSVKGKVNVESARIRKSPDGETLTSLKNGTEVIILSEENDWYKIKTSDYDSCYIAKRLITKNN